MLTEKIASIFGKGRGLKNFDMDRSWNSQWIVKALRHSIGPLVAQRLAESDVPFDPQDLEHQTLFFLTTYDPSAITEEIIAEAVRQQWRIIRERLLSVSTKEELAYLFRGLTGNHHDLNCNDRLMLTNRRGQLTAVGKNRSYEVECRLLDDPRIAALYTGALHYIHQARLKGKIFAFFFKNDPYPWAIETTERGESLRRYKRDALALRSINPDKTVELTRFYTLPGAPRNAISLMDGFTRKHFATEGLEAMFTCTMPAYSKTKSTTIAGGINEVLCVRELRHHFVPVDVDGERCWKHVTKRWVEENEYHGPVKSTHPAFRLLPVIDVYTKLHNGKKTVREKTSAKNNTIFIPSGSPAIS